MRYGCMCGCARALMNCSYELGNGISNSALDCLQGLMRSLSGNRDGGGQSQEALLRTLEHRLGLRGSGGGGHPRGAPRGSSSSGGRSRSRGDLNNLERMGSTGSEQRLYRGSRSDGESANHGTASMPCQHFCVAMTAHNKQSVYCISASWVAISAGK